MAQKVFRYLEPFSRDSWVWRTDRQTDRRYHSKCCASLRWAATKNKRFGNTFVRHNNDSSMSQCDCSWMSHVWHIQNIRTFDY